MRGKRGVVAREEERSRRAVGSNQTTSLQHRKEQVHWLYTHEVFILSLLPGCCLGACLPVLHVICTQCVCFTGGKEDDLRSPSLPPSLPPSTSLIIIIRKTNLSTHRPPAMQKTQTPFLPPALPLLQTHAGRERPERSTSLPPPLPLSLLPPPPPDKGIRPV